MLVQAAEFSGALAILSEAEGIPPPNPDVLVALAIAEAKSGQERLAITRLKSATHVAPAHLEAWTMLAELTLAVADYEAFTLAAETAVALDPEVKHPCGVRARALIRKAQKRLQAP